MMIIVLSRLHRVLGRLTTCGGRGEGKTRGRTLICEEAEVGSEAFRSEIGGTTNGH
jgi:hypothetical protein